jgi:hypothetical protein
MKVGQPATTLSRGEAQRVGRVRQVQPRRHAVADEDRTIVSLSDWRRSQTASLSAEGGTLPRTLSIQRVFSVASRSYAPLAERRRSQWSLRRRTNADS